MTKKMQKQTPQISAYFAYFALTLPTMHFTHTRKIKVRKLRRRNKLNRKSMMTKSMVNLSFKIAMQFLPSNAGFSFVKVRKIDEDESQMDDDEKTNCESFI